MAVNGKRSNRFRSGPLDTREFVLPAGLGEIDAAFMTAALRRSGVIDGSNEVVSVEESGVGMTAGYFSDIKRIRCAYRKPTTARDSFVAKAWPAFEILPKDALRAMFVKDIRAYHFPADRFYPRPQAILAEADVANDLWALVMEDAETFAEHKVHEQEMTIDETLRMVPKLVEVAVAWEGCDQGPKGDMLAKLGVDLWASETNLGLYKSVMPGGAKLLDRLTTMAHSSLITGPTWDRYLGPGICELFTKRLEAFFAGADPANGATCTLSHGDLRGDNLFFCEPNDRYPDGWLCIDFQLMFRGPVPSDLAYLMGTATVLPEVYARENLRRVLRMFYDQFMAKTVVYGAYSYEQFEREFAMMSAVHFVYAVGMGAAIWQAGAFKNERAARVELGGQGVTEADLTPQELRQRMWWRKLIANYRENFKNFDQYARLKSLSENLQGLGPWADLPSHLR
jgi:hypothetical protein